MTTSQDARGPEITPIHIASVFVLYLLASLAFLSLNMPPFQHADESEHFFRAMQLADGRILGSRFTATRPNGSTWVRAGAEMDSAATEASLPFQTLKFHPDAKAVRSMWAPSVHWSTQRRMTDISNTELYPPQFYLPSVAGILLGRAANLTVVQTLILSRIFTGIAAIGIGAAAIALSGRAAIWLFAVLTLPMSLALLASTSQDALLLTSMALFSALFLRLSETHDQGSRRRFVWSAILLGLVATARPPYCVLSILLLAVSAVAWWWRVVATACVIVFVAGWTRLMSATAFVPTAGDWYADPAAQVALIRAEPLRLIWAVWTSRIEWRAYLGSFIGVLGWLDTWLPHWYYLFALTMLAIAICATLLGERANSPGFVRAVTLFAVILLSCAATVCVLYITANEPGGLTVRNIQGRYFLPLAIAASVALPAIGTARLRPVVNGLTILVLLSPVLSLAVMMRTIVLRYYLN